MRIQYGERIDLPPELKKQKAKGGMFKDLGMIAGMKCVSIVHLWLPSFAMVKRFTSPAEITKNYSIPRRGSASQRRFVLVDFPHMNAAGRLRVYEADDMSAARRAVAHAAAKRGLVARENCWALSAMMDR
jgi:hypothetical protein